LQQGPHRTRILIADDDAPIRAAMNRLLSSDCEVVGSVADLATLFDVIVQLRPDVLLLDFSLPGELNAFEVCRRVKSMTPEVQIVALTAYDDADIRRGAHEAGFSGFVWKMRAPTELMSTIQTVLDGRARSGETG
jgi:DNA-binding NarL/FixJ family response regulator